MRNESEGQEELELLEVVSQLRERGYVANSISELRDSGLNYKDAVPELARLLETVSTAGAKEQIARALSFPWAKPEATPSLLRQFADLPFEIDPSGLGVRWTIGNAIYSIDDRAAVSDMVRLAGSREFGRAREMIVLELGRIKTPQAIDTLIALLDDPDVDGHAIKALGSRGITVSPSIFRARLSDDRPWVRSAARRALARTSSLD